MASKTTNYNLHKIDLADSPPDITVLNQNFDVIDSELKEQDNALAKHLDETEAHSETSDRTIYVGSNRKYKNLQQALATVKKDLGGKTITILFDDGNYISHGKAFGSGFFNGVLNIASASYSAVSVTLGDITVIDCNCKLQISDITINVPATCLSAYRTNTLIITNVRLIGVNKSAYGVFSENSNVEIRNCEISDKGTAIIANFNSQLHSSNNNGANNDIALHAIGAFITTFGAQPSAITAKTEVQGGLIRP